MCVYTSASDHHRGFALERYLSPERVQIEEGVAVMVMEVAAVADVPADQLAYLCDGHGCGVSHSVRHGGHGKSDLLTHLTEVRYVLKKQLFCAVTLARTHAYMRNMHASMLCMHACPR